MTGPQIVCPKCNTSIKLTDSLAAPLIAKTRKQFEQQVADRELEFTKRESNLRKTQKALAEARKTIDDEIANRLRSERSAIVESESKKARIALAADFERQDEVLAELRYKLDANNAKLAEAQQAHADFLRKSREIDDAKRELALSVERKVQESLSAVRDKAKTEVEESLKSKVAEKEAQISGMMRQIEELRRKAEQGSQQLQGEALELELESLLRDRFPRDLFEPVPKGEFGGDIIHRVFGHAGQRCGTILWESKRTKTWSDSWLSKLRADQRAAKADIALVVSNVLPKGIDSFDLIDQVWVTKLRFALPLAIALRQSLIAVASGQRAAQGQRTKMETVYEYLTGPRFRHRIDAIVEKFTDMQTDLERERRTMMRQWAKREEQLKEVLHTSAGLYGDLQGIAGRSIPQIESLELPMIEDKVKTPTK